MLQQARWRGSNFGIHRTKGVRRVLDADGVHIVRGWPVEVRPFVRPADPPATDAAAANDQQHVDDGFLSSSNRSPTSSSGSISSTVRSDTE
mmetsp:Transcript_27309/g.22574  ORF Transcript_27309/g.22574 Transcript_27309/m.22574 type:complete len:91 (-) Transcript_27309:217-489(-)